MQAKHPQAGQLEFVLQPRSMKTAHHDPNWGGAGRGQGQKPLYPDQGRLIPVAIRLTEEQKEKLARLGGPQWIRDRIDKAKG